VSPRKVIPVENGALSPIAERVLNVGSLTHEHNDDGIVVAGAAHPEVIGVASTNRRGNGRAWFSNWGEWCDCCARGDYVYSTFVHWDGPVEGESPDEIEHFRGWARWDGTSFAAPKVSAAIACLVAESGGSLLPVEASRLLLRGETGVPVTPLTDFTLSAPAGVTLPNLDVG